MWIYAIIGVLVGSFATFLYFENRYGDGYEYRRKKEVDKNLEDLYNRKTKEMNYLIDDLVRKVQLNTYSLDDYIQIKNYEKRL